MHKLWGLLKKKGVFFTLYMLGWMLVTAWQKKLILWQDRHQLFNYPHWLARQEAPAAELERQRHSSGLGTAPFFSFLIPVHEEDLSLLASTLGSIREQTVPGWKVYLACGPQTRERIEGDQRIDLVEGRIVFCDSPNRYDLPDEGDGLILWCYPGDRFAPDLLYQAAQIIQQDTQVEILYTDEDDGSASGAFLKPDWSPALLLSVNYLETAFFSCGLLRRACPAGAASAWDLALRSTVQAHRIVHIPRVLVHRINPVWPHPPRLEDNTAIQEALERRGLEQVSVERTSTGQIHAAWQVSSPVRVSIVIPTRDKVAYLRRCLESIRRLTPEIDYEIILIDTGSREPETLVYYEELKEWERLIYLEDHAPFNYSRVNNLGASRSQGDLLLFLNNDVEVLAPTWLAELVRWAQLKEVGVVGPRLLFPDGTIQHAGIVMGVEGHASHIFGGMQEHAVGPFGSADWVRNYAAVTGACMMLRREVFQAVGGFDERYTLVFSDVKICLDAIAKGYQVVYNPFCRITHFEGASRAQSMPDEDLVLGLQDFRPWVERGDPYFNPNLSHAVRVPTFRRPWEDNPLRRLERIVSRVATLSDHDARR